MRAVCATRAFLHDSCRLALSLYSTTVLTCVDLTFLGTDGTKKAATDPAMASALTTVPFIAQVEREKSGLFGLGGLFLRGRCLRL